MGLEKIIGFLNKNLSYNGIKELSVNNCSNKTIAENILFDFNFIIYVNLVELENDINHLLKILYSLPYIEISTIEKELEKILNLKYMTYFKDEITKIIDGDNKDNIIKNLNHFLFSKEKLIEYEQKILEINILENNTLIDLILFIKIFHYLDDRINNIHYIEFVKNVFIFFDGIPSYSKILEQKRRRTKNYLESKIRKKIFQEIFDNFKNDIYDEDNLSYNYFEWLNKKISLDKSFGPSSKIILDLELCLKLFQKKKIFKVNYKIHVCSGKIMGESDFKIFKFIKKKKISDNVYIHTCDSDLVHLVLVQQIYNIIFQKKTKYYIIRYFSRDNSVVQYVDAVYIVKELMKIIKKNFHINESNYYILLDFLGLCYLFGNDHIPHNNWFGTEFSFEEIILMLKGAYKQENTTMLKFNKNKNIEFNWNIFLNFLKILSSNQSILKINLLKYHKNNDIIYVYINQLKISFDEFKNDYIPKYLSYLGYKKTLDTSLDKSLLDETYYWDIHFYNKLKHEQDPFEDYFKGDKLARFHTHLDKFLNIYRCDNRLIKKYVKQMDLEENNYQNLYKYISVKSYNIGQKKYPNIFKSDYTKEEGIEEESSEMIENYLLMYYYMITTFFKNMENYNTYNLIHYKYISAPSLDSIISYLNKTNLNELSHKFNKIIKDNIIKKDKYFNNLSHHLFITPYLLKSNYLKKIVSIDNIEDILNSLDKVKNLCIDESNYNYNFKLIPPKLFLNKWDNIEENIINKDKCTKNES
tara:strand:- start:500 stop:2761 length:2262 start_codon:yes stop_codon:yes gene_type:complete